MKSIRNKAVLALAAVSAVFGGAVLTGAGAAPEPKAKVNEAAPTFTLTDTEGKKYDLAAYTEQGKTVVLEWFNPMCPYVVKHYGDAEHQTMNQLVKEFEGQDVVWLRINSGHEGHDTTGKELNDEYKAKWDIAGPILLDESGEVGKLYGAKTTPHMFVIDSEGILRYAGAIDNNANPRKFGDRNYVEEALKAVLSGETVEVQETCSYGCSVKYGKGG